MITGNESGNLLDIVTELEERFSRRYEELGKREKLVEEQERKVKRDMRRVDKLLSRLSEVDNEDVLEAADTIIGVDEVYSVDHNEKVERPTVMDYTYEMMLRNMEVGDCITVPVEFLKKLVIYMKSSLYGNSSNTNYKILAMIKFNVRLEENIVAIIDCMEDSERARIIIFKRYDRREVGEEEIGRMIVEYGKWQRKVPTYNESL